MHWDDLRFFLAVERGGTLSMAASRLGVDATTVGRRIERLSAAVDAPLFEAGPSGHRLTEAGDKLLHHAEAVERAILAASGDLLGETKRLAGTVRISLSEGFATAIVAPHLPAFRDAHPGILLEVATTNGFLNPSKREADLAVMLGRPSSGSLTVQRLTDYRLGLFASRDYLEGHGPIANLAELRRRTLIGYIPDFIYSEELRYLHEVDPGLHPHVTSSSINVQHAMTRGGLGVCVLPHFMARRDPMLLPVMADDVVITRSFWMVVHADLRRVARVAAVTDWLRGIAGRAAGGGGLDDRGSDGSGAATLG